MTAMPNTRARSQVLAAVAALHAAACSLAVDDGQEPTVEPRSMSDPDAPAVQVVASGKVGDRPLDTMAPERQVPEPGREQPAVEQPAVEQPALEVPATPELCDGSATVRLRYGVGGGGSTVTGLSLLLQNGWSYWLITGNCHYYAMSAPLSPVVEGDLSRDEAQEIAEGVLLGRLHELSGGYRASFPLFDASGESLTAGSDGIGCYGPCEVGEHGPAPAEAQQAMEFARDVRERLSNAGNPVDGPVLISVLRYGATAVHGALPPERWPLSSAPEVLAGDEESVLNGTYEGTLIEGRVDLRALRQMREAAGGADFVFEYAIDDLHMGRDELRFRDVIPLEDSDGRIQFEFDPALLAAELDAGLP
jgi:hypothetical protein